LRPIKDLLLDLLELVVTIPLLSILLHVLTVTVGIKWRRGDEATSTSLLFRSSTKR
jgi:hypothetical protein